ncbi:MAG: DegT/DnrJ/EryC1/StrS family aminotransferase [Planctomycetes bacterium]|nr:DegT/DnrJ/EryC1/StrS family aminotransferase [Planctomycetota bacterium]
MSNLAILGGEVVRKVPFHTSAVIDNDEWEMVKEVMERKEFSRFMGSPSADIQRYLEMSSVDAESLLGQYYTFLGGRMVRRFEAAFARKFGVKYAVSVNSATSGLSAALGAIRAGPGDEVITTCMSFNATATSILVFNSIPVFVDIDRKNFCMDPVEVERAITPRTRAILVVHLLGNTADMDAIMDIAKRRGLSVIEDCSQSPGTRYRGRLVGNIGDIGVFSFQETKNMQTGEGGMAITNDPVLAKRMRLIRNHGESICDDAWDEASLENIIGMNYRMNELTAALGVAQIGKLDENNAVRSENARFLSSELGQIRELKVPMYEEGTVPHLYPLIYDEAIAGVERAKILAALRAEGIPVGSGYLRLMYENPLFLKKVGYGRNHCPWSCHLYGQERYYRRGDCPVGEELLYKTFIWFYHIHRPNTIEDMRDVVRAFKKVFANLSLLRESSINTTIGYKW